MWSQAVRGYVGRNMTSTNKKAIYIRVEPEERERIQKAAKQGGVSVSKLGANLLLNFAANAAFKKSRRTS